MSIKNPKSKALLYGALNAICVFTLGFFTLFIMWNFGHYPSNLRGFYYYKAATFGDGICLPVMIFSLSTTNYYYSIQKNIRANRMVWIITAISVIFGILIQLSWLRNPNIVLNWTIPKAGCFNFPGWYHAVFFVLMFGLSAYHITYFFFLINDVESGISQFDLQMYGGFISSGGTYLLVHFGDDYGEKVGYIPLFVGIMCVLFLILKGCIRRMNRAKQSQYTATLLMGLLLAFGVATWIFIRPQGGQILISLGGAFCACLLWCEKSIEQLISTTVETMIAVFMCFYTATAVNNLYYQILILLIILIVSIIVSHINYAGYQWHFLPLVLISLYILRYVVLNPISEIVLEEAVGNVTDVLFYAAFIVLFKKEIRNRFSYVEQAEVGKNKGDIGETEFGIQKGISYANIILVTAGVFCVLLQWLIDVGSKASTGSIASGEVEIQYFEFTGILICLAFILLMNKKKALKERDFWIAGIAALLVYILIFICVIRSIGMHDLLVVDSYQWYLVILSIFAVIGYPILLAHGFYMNLVQLRGNKENRRVRIFSFIILIGGEIVSISNLMILFFDATYVGIVKLIVTSVITCIIMPAILGCLQRMEFEKSSVVPDTWIGGVIQDGFSASLVQILLVGVPCFYVGLMDNKNDFSGWLAILGLVVLAMHVVGFFINNNVKHVERQRGVLEQHPEEKEKWFQLREALIKQNMITIFMTLPYFFLRIIFDGVGLIIGKKDNDEDNRIYRQLMSKYIDLQKYRETFLGNDGKLHYCFEIEKKLMKVKEVSDCTVTKLSRENREGIKYIAVFLRLNEEIEIKEALEIINKSVPGFANDNGWMELFQVVNTSLYGEDGRDIQWLKGEYKGFYNRNGQRIEI